MTNAWKQKVRDRLAENKRNNVRPRDQAELAEAIGAGDKSAITKMFQAQTSMFVPLICQVLQIAAPMQERKEQDPLDEFVNKLGTPTDRERAVQALRLLFPDLS